MDSIEENTETAPNIFIQTQTIEMFGGIMLPSFDKLVLSTNLEDDKSFCVCVCAGVRVSAPLRVLLCVCDSWFVNQRSIVSSVNLYAANISCAGVACAFVWQPAGLRRTADGIAYLQTDSFSKWNKVGIQIGRVFFDHKIHRGHCGLARFNKRFFDLGEQHSSTI